MNPKQTIPIAAGLAPLAAAVPGLLLIAGAGLVLCWLLSDDDEKKAVAPVDGESSGDTKPESSPWTFFDEPAQPRKETAIPRHVLTPAPTQPKSVSAPTVAPAKPPVSAPAVAIPSISTTIPQKTVLIPANSANKPQVAAASPPRNTVPSPVTTRPAIVKRVTREDLAEALAYGERQFTRKEAVAGLEALGFRKSAAYKALSVDGKFGSLIEFTTDGLIEWKG
jgi:hypothetical protein